jgi:hypothetical protein
MPTTHAKTLSYTSTRRRCSNCVCLASVVKRSVRAKPKFKKSKIQDRGRTYNSQGALLRLGLLDKQPVDRSMLLFFLGRDCSTFPIDSRVNLTTARGVANLCRWILCRNEAFGVLLRHFVLEDKHFVVRASGTFGFRPRIFTNAATAGR